MKGSKSNEDEGNDRLLRVRDCRTSFGDLKGDRKGILKMLNV